jgi:hypothetical protein
MGRPNDPRGGVCKSSSDRPVIAVSGCLHGGIGQRDDAFGVCGRAGDDQRRIIHGATELEPGSVSYTGRQRQANGRSVTHDGPLYG